ncbi:maleylpyruvate isomerase N-terminal domain-containing protein [Propioniciclava tarda]|uniref:Mycothiol maleylpyruvate isomerase n=1 Tax=Propioniciclava tarda TaxID=433330 RepID=A0A4Q9KN74_PROTD|nr:maleylpyruvate isomerase N-terminal domain-containing protein [Propioniciclava tarda]TBT95725.1 mycothiol maleylpyruvate isomerase [Propioniciclava tarda]SMO45086.1 TIGR03083 family protein [Propioniciclava tarda]
MTTAEAWFTDATQGVLELVEQIPAGTWDVPGLGDWTLRELVAHTGRSWTLLGTYLAEPTPGAVGVGTAASYVARGLVQPGIHAGVLARGREDALGLGDDPATTLRGFAAEAMALVAATPPGRLVPTRICPLPLGEFVKTRAFELTVHGLDIARAAGLPIPEALDRATGPALALASEIAAERGLAAPLLLAAAGREPLPAGFTLLG